MEVNNKEENKQAFGIQQGSEFSPNIFSHREQQRNKKKKNPRIYKGTGITAFQVLKIMGVKLFSQK